MHVKFSLSFTVVGTMSNRQQSSQFFLTKFPKDLGKHAAKNPVSFKITSPNDLLYKLVFPQVGEKFFPGQGQDVVGTGTYRILANQDEIFKYTFLF